MKYVSYIRVSTDRQGQSGFGLEAQQTAVDAFVQGKGEIIANYVEVESGNVTARPELENALADAKRSGATLLIAKLDRLARNVAFIANLLEAGVEVTAVDMPEANRFMFHIMAAVAEQEALAISERTKAALAAAKARGQKLGMANPKVSLHMAKAVRHSVATRVAKANGHAAKVLPLVERIAIGGASLRQIAAELNLREIKTARGGKWYAATVRNMLAREVRTKVAA